MYAGAPHGASAIKSRLACEQAGPISASGATSPCTAPTQSMAPGAVPAGRAHCVINSAARLAGSAILAGWHTRFTATVVGIRGWLGGNRSQTDADP